MCVFVWVFRLDIFWLARFLCISFSALFSYSAFLLSPLTLSCSHSLAQPNLRHKRQGISLHAKLQLIEFFNPSHSQPFPGLLTLSQCLPHLLTSSPRTLSILIQCCAHRSNARHKRQVLALAHVKLQLVEFASNTLDQLARFTAAVVAVAVATAGFGGNNVCGVSVVLVQQRGI